MYPHGNAMLQCPLVMLLICVNIHTAWASALLILGYGQCEGLTSGMSDDTRFPRFFMWILQTNVIVRKGTGGR